MFAPTTAIFLSLLINLYCSSNLAGKDMSSASIRAITFEDDILIPLFSEAAIFILVLLLTIFIRGYFLANDSIILRVLSVEQSFTTISSKSLKVCFKILSIALIMNF